MKKFIGIVALLILAFICTVSVHAETPSPTATMKPLQTINPYTSPTPTPVPATPTPAPTMGVLVTAEPEVTPTPMPTDKPDTQITAVPKETTGVSDSKTEEKETEEDDTNSVATGELVFWVLVALLAGIWVGIIIGAIIWRKKSVFMSEKEKKIIGRL